MKFEKSQIKKINSIIKENIKSLAKAKKTTLRKISLSLEFDEDYLSKLLNRSDYIFSLQHLVSIMLILECELSELLVNIDIKIMNEAS